MAMEACYGAFKVKTLKTIDIARSAFINAAEEAGMV
ncbi:DUF982 domain-containing protein [Chelatococcus sp. YT9]|nr:DUF982 domain-containing protein [Chelatococcus sp. YT9]